MGELVHFPGVRRYEDAEIDAALEKMMKLRAAAEITGIWNHSSAMQSAWAAIYDSIKRKRGT